MLTLNDGRSELWQWDTGRTLAVDADCSQVHFSNKVFGRSIDVDVADGVAIIPDVLLQTDKELNVWAFVGTAENGYTKISKTFKVNRRNKPSDYVFTPQEQILLKDAIAIVETAKSAANDAMESAKQAEDSSTQAAKRADAAADSASAAAVAKQAAAQSASASDNAANFAGEKATAAQQAADTATAAANYAGQSASAAAASKAAAETAAKTAQGALTATSEAKADAVKAQVAAAKASSDAQGYMQAASSAATAANASAENAAVSKAAAENSASAAARSEQAAGESEVKAAESEKAAKASEQAAAESAQAALKSKTAAAISEGNAAASAKKAKDIADSLPEDYTTAVNEIAALKTNKADKTELETVNQQVANITPDDTAVDGKPWTSKKIVDSLCQPFEESGNPVQCHPVENYPLGVKVSWEPTQAGEGDPSPDNIRPITGRDAVSVTRCGKNMLDMSKCVAARPPQAYDLTVMIDGDTIHISGVPNVSIDFPNAMFRVFRINQNALLANINNLKVTTFDANDEIKYISIDSDRYFVIQTPLYKGQEKDCTFRVMMSYDTPTTYEPYTGDTYDIALPETVYGGEVDAVSGDAKETWKLMTFDGTEMWMDNGSIPEKKQQQWALYRILEPYSGISAISSHFSNTKSNSIYVYPFNFVRVANTSIVLHVALDGPFATVGDLKSYLAAQYAAGTPVQVCYKLAEPVPFTATGTQPIPALSGANTILTDADGVIVTGAEDPKHTITELKNAIISLGGNV